MRFTRCIPGRVTGAMIAATALFFCLVASAAPTSLEPAIDLGADAKSVANGGVPLIVLVSLPGCPHCEVVRRSHLLPILNDATATRKPLIRQVELNGQEILRDFSGRTTTHGEFSRRYKIRIAPVVMFFDARGEMIAAPLVGSTIPDFYGAYFDAALAEARSRLPATRP
jgi:thioredoxin-related protein